MLEHQIKGNVFNVFNTGAYLIFRLYPENRVLIDGRTELYQETGVFSNYFYLSNPKAVETLSDEFDMHCVILPCDSSGLIPNVFSYLYKSSNWSLVFFDGRSSVFLKNTADYRDLVANAAISLDSFKIAPDYELISEAIERRYYPAAFLNAASFFLSINMPLKSLELLEIAGRILPDDSHVYHLKGIAFAKLGKRKEALDMFERSAEIDPKNPTLVKNISVLYILSGQVDIARRYLEEALKIDPADKDLKKCLRDLDKMIEGKNISLQAD